MRKVLFLSTLSFFFAASLGAQTSRPDLDAQAKQAVLPGSASPAALQAARDSFAKLPLSFEENLGQTDRRVKYTSRGFGYNVFLTADEAVFALRGRSASSNCAGKGREFNRDCANSPANQFEVSVLRLKMLGANSSAQILGSDPLPGKINYYVGNDPSKWRTGVRQYGRVSYQGIYPGVDLTYYGNQQQLESDFVVEPGASARAIEFEVAGARELRLDEHGNLVLGTDAGNVQILRPGIYQTIKGVRRDISGRYVIRGKDRVGLEIASYNRQSPLIIDPILVYSTYLGGSNIFSGGDSGNAIAIDSTGAAYVTGTGGSIDFPGSAQNGPVAEIAPFAYVTKFDPTGNSIVYSTLLRGTTGFTDAGNGIGLDNKGNVYVDGITGDSDFPLLNPFQATLGDVFSAGFSNVLQSGFVAGLDSNGALIYSTYLGGRNSDDFTYLNGIAVDANGDAYVVGQTTSQNFPTVNSIQATSNVAFQGEPNVVVAEFNPQGQPIYSTYLGGSSRDVGNAIAIDASGNAYMTGETSSTDFPVQKTPAPTPFQATNGGGEDVFVSKLTFDSAHSTLSLANSTYLGGAGNDEAFGIAVDSATPPNVYLTGQTFSKGITPFPTQNPISGPSTGFAPEAFVTKLSGDFTSLLYSTFLGGTGGPSTVGDAGYGIALDGMNPPDVFITGSTASVDFPSQLPLQSILTPLATSNAFVTEVNGTGTALLYSTYLGGRGADLGKGIAVDRPTGDAYITGKTTSPNFPVVGSSGGATKPFQDQIGTSAGNAFITKISPAAASGLNFFPPTFDFHNMGVGLVSQAESVTLSNNSGGSVTLNSLSLGGNNPSDFAPGTVGSTCSNGLMLTATGATSSCVVNLTFNPQLQDARSATLTATYNSASIATMNLLGFGAVPELSFSPATLNFGTNVPLNVTTVRGVSLTNTGGGPLNVGNVEITGTDASAYRIPSPSACKLIAADGGSCFIEVDFTPTAAVSYNNAALQINDNVAGSPQSIPITGAGAAQVIVSPTSVEFGGWLVGTSSPDRSINVLNGSGGNITLSTTSAGNTPDFPPDPNNTTCTSGLVMLPGVSCMYDTYFKPATGSTFDGLQAVVTFSWTGTMTGSQAVTVMGTGETGVTLYQNSITAPTEYVGATERSIGFDQIFNGTTSPVAVTSIVLSGANPQDYLVELNTSCSTNAVIPANSVCYLDGAFSPSAVGTRSATATINYTINSPTPTSGSLTLNVTGTGNPGPVNFPSAFDFGSQIVNILAPAERVYLQNVGKVPLAISTVSVITGANANDFAIASSSTCASSTIVPNGGKCFFDLTFTPDKTGSLTASLTVTDNGPGSPRTLTLTGTGEPAADTVSVLPNALDFGGVVLVAPPSTQPQSVAKIYLTNAGAQPATISVAPALTATGTPFTIATGTNTTTCLLNTVVLPQGGTCSVVVTFTPTNTVQQTNSLTLTYTVGTVQTLVTVPIKGIGVNQAVLSFGTPATFTEAKSAPTSAPQTVKLTNSGTGPVTISSLYLTGGSSSDFAIVPTQSTCSPGTTGVTIAAGGSCIVAVTFTAPATVGTYTASALVTADLGNNVKGSASTTLAGTVVAGGLNASPNPIDFGTVATGASVTFSSLHSFNSILLTNNNPAPVAITSIAPQNAGDFTVTNNGCPASPATLSNLIFQNSCDFDITFAPGPTVNGPEPANNIVVSYSIGGQNGQFLIPIKGAGSPALVASPNPLNATGSVGGFGSNPTITIGNGTTSLVAITSVDTFSAAGFSSSSNSCTIGALGPGTTCQIFLTYNPTVPGNSSTSFNVTYTVGSSTTPLTLVVTLNGSATAPQATITPNPSPSTPLVFPSQVINSQSLPLSVVVTNTGNAPLTFNSFKISGTNFNDFAMAPQQTNFSPSQYPSIESCSFFGFGNTIQPSQSCTIPLTFTPAPPPLPGGTTRSATLTITDNAYPSKTQTVLLEGNATGGSVTVSPTSLSFPDAIVGSSVTQNVLVTNSSAAAVTFTSVSFGTSSYSVDSTQTLNACSTSKPLSAFTGSCVVYIKFTPQLGANADTATIHTNSNSPTVALSGTGKISIVSVSPTSLTFTGTRISTTSAQQTVTLTNATLSQVTISGSPSKSGANPGDFNVVTTGTTCTGGATVAGSGGSCNVIVTFSPATGALGTRTATLTITESTGSHPVTLTGTAVGPSVQVASSVALGNQAVNQTGTMSLTVTNTGTDTLNLASASATAITASADSTFFGIGGTTTCTNGLAIPASGSCTISVTFTPTTVRSYGPVTLVITDDAGAVAGTKQSVSLTGSGVAAQVTPSPSPATFTSSQIVGVTSSNLTVTLTNSGGLDLHLAASSAVTIGAPGNALSDFAIVSAGTTCINGATVAKSGGTCTVVLTFNPSSTGARSATLIFSDDGTPGTQPVTLNGTGIAPVASVPSALSFGDQLVSVKSAQQTVTLTNTGTASLTIASVVIDPASTNASDFAIVAGAGTTCVASGTVSSTAGSNTCTVALTITPGAAGARGPAVLKFTDNSNGVAGSVQSVNLTGTGQTPPTATLSAGSISFGNQRVNTASTAQNVTITNNGGAPLSITSIAITGSNTSDFAFASPATTCPTSASGQVAPAASCTLSVTFDPTAANARSASITITVSGITSPAPITLSGTGIAPVATPSAATAPFGNQEVSTSSAAQNGTLNNTGTDVLHITAVAITGANASDFSIVTAGTSCATGLPTAVTVAAAANCTWSVKFTPTALGSRTASLTFTDDSGATAGSTQSVALTGTGAAPVVMLAPTTVSFGAQALNTTSAPMNGTLTNTGTMALHLATATITGTNAGDFAIAAGGTTCTNSSTVAPSNGSCTWSVTFTPTASGTRTATLTFTDDNNGVTGSTQTVALTGITGPAATLSPSTPIAFANQAVGTTSSASSITVTNPGGSALHITSVAISGANAAEFAVATTGTTCTNGSTVAPAASCVINVTFTPATAGARGPATLTITDDASPTIQTVSLTGTGTSFTLSVPTPPVPAAAGQPIVATIMLTPGGGGFMNPVTFSASNLPPDTTASFSQATLTPGAAAVTTMLTLATTARSGGYARSTPPSQGPISGGWICTALLALLAMVTLRRGLRMQRFAYLPLAVLLLSAAIITGCTSAPTGTPAGSYTVTVKATSGSYSQSTPVAITVR